MEMSPTLRERFERKIVASPSGCDEWTGVVNNTGYGMISIAASTSRPAHRVAWFLHHGAWPEKCILHSCDNRRCVTVAHMSVGTKGDNNRDTARKRRLPSGDNHHNTKIPEAELDGLMLRRKNGAGLNELAADYGVSISLISQICLGRIRTLRAVA